MNSHVGREGSIERRNKMIRTSGPGNNSAKRATAPMAKTEKSLTPKVQHSSEKRRLLNLRKSYVRPKSKLSKLTSGERASKK